MSIYSYTVMVLFPFSVLRLTSNKVKHQVKVIKVLVDYERVSIIIYRLDCSRINHLLMNQRVLFIYLLFMKTTHSVTITQGD